MIGRAEPCEQGSLVQAVGALDGCLHDMGAAGSSTKLLVSDHLGRMCALLPSIRKLKLSRLDRGSKAMRGSAVHRLPWQQVIYSEGTRAQIRQPCRPVTPGPVIQGTNVAALGDWGAKCSPIDSPLYLDMDRSQTADNHGSLVPS